MNYLLCLDYFATGEGRLIAFAYQHRADKTILKNKMEQRLETQYYTPGFDVYNVDELLLNIRNKNITKEQNVYLELLKEHVPVFYKHLMVCADKGGVPIESLHYFHRINLT